MAASEPLPHFVDALLGFLHETHPTHATLDGVHVHDDLLEDFSRPAIDAEAQTVSVRGAAPVRLTHLEFRLLQLLVANAGHTLPAERLLRHVWGDRATGDRQTLKQLVHRLRQKIEADASAPRYLVTASGIGYTLQATGEEG